VDRQHFTDDIEYAVSQDRTHLFKLFKKSLENAAFDNRLAFLRGTGHEVEGMNIPLLTDAVNASEPLFESGGVPGEVVVNHQPAKLQVYAFASGFCRYADLLFSAELFLGALPFMRIHTAVDVARRVSPAAEMFAKVVQRIAVLGEDKKLPSAVAKLLEFGP